MNSLFKCLLLIAVVAGVAVMYNNTTKPDYISKFDISAEAMTKDLDGKLVQLPYGQVWPFDPTQSLNLDVVAKKQVDELVVVLVDVKAFANVSTMQAHEQGTTNGKQTVKEKLPAKVRLNGYAKLTYENIGEYWNLMSVDNVSLRASPAD
jgi:hypothetical protein